MSRKKPKKPGIIVSLLAVVALLGVWLLMSPLSPPPHRPSPVSVKVEEPAPLPEPKPEVATEAPPSEPQPAPSAAPTATAAVGDEKAQPQVAMITVPVEPEREQVLPPGHKPVIAIVIDDVGLDLRGSKRAIDLPAYVTLSFMPYATRFLEQTSEARENGHELMLHMPMEPLGHEDPGPGALLTNLQPDEIRRRFENALASFTGFDGVNNHMGSKFTAETEGMEIVVDELQQRHLFYLDSRTSAKSVGEHVAREHGLPTIARDVFLDDDMSLSAVNRQLDEVEHVARRKGYAVAIGHPHDNTMTALAAWLPEAEKRGFVFVPVHDLLKPRVVQVNVPN